MRPETGIDSIQIGSIADGNPSRGNTARRGRRGIWSKVIGVPPWNVAVLYGTFHRLGAGVGGYLRTLNRTPEEIYSSERVGNAEKRRTRARREFFRFPPVARKREVARVESFARSSSSLDPRLSVLPTTDERFRRARGRGNARAEDTRVISSSTSCNSTRHARCRRSSLSLLFSCGAARQLSAPHKYL